VVYVFDAHVTVHRDGFSYNKIQLDTVISQIYSWNETLHISDSSSVRHQFADSLQASCQQTV